MDKVHKPSDFHRRQHPLHSNIIFRPKYLTVYMFVHNLLNVLVQIANKMGLQKQKYITKHCYFNLYS
jgi:hypothetical protein